MSSQTAPERLDIAARDAWKNVPLPGKPLPGFCLVVREDPQQYSTLALPEQHKEQGRAMMAEARVLAVGNPVKLAKGELLETEIMAGDRVLTQGYNRFATHKIDPRDDVIYEFLAWSQVAAILNEIPERVVPSFLELPDQVEDEEPKLRPVAP